jgi:hypothetical protein
MEGIMAQNWVFTISAVSPGFSMKGNTAITRSVTRPKECIPLDLRSLKEQYVGNVALDRSVHWKYPLVIGNNPDIAKLGSLGHVGQFKYPLNAVAQSMTIEIYTISSQPCSLAPFFQTHDQISLCRDFKLSLKVEIRPTAEGLFTFPTVGFESKKFDLAEFSFIKTGPASFPNRG